MSFEISSNLGERHTKFSESQSDKVRSDLHQLRMEKAALANRIREYILTDSQQSLVVDGVKYSPIDAAKLIAQYEADIFCYNAKEGDVTYDGF